MASRRRSGKLNTEDEDYYYSDDFVSDDDEETGRKRSSYVRHSQKLGRAPARGKLYATRGPGRGRGRNNQTQNKSPRTDYITQRMLSAGRVKINEYRNQVEDQKGLIKELREENKLLKKLQYRQEKALEKFEDKESDLPQLLIKHNNEIRSLKDQLKKTKEKYEQTDRYLRDAEDDLERMKSKLKKYKHLVEDKNLQEREDLTKKLDKASLDCEEKDSKIKELERHITNLKKNHRHELGVEIARHRETKHQLETYKDTNERMEMQLKEKEKELEMKNIYSNRVIRAPHKLPASYGGTPLDTPSPPHHPRKRAPSLSEIPSREKAKLYEAKRKEEDKLKGQRKARGGLNQKTKCPNDESKQTEHLDLFHQQNGQNGKDDLWEIEVKEQHNLENIFRRDHVERQREEEAREEEKWKEEERVKAERERIKRDAEERHRIESEKIERKRREQLEKQEREQREQREREERQERERIEEEERQEREREREREKMEKRVQEQKKRMESDPQFLEDRRKKDMLLARMKAIDQTKENASPFIPSKLESGYKDTFDPFVSVTQNRSPAEESSASTPSSKKSYIFTRPIENLHSGKPAYDDVSVPYLERQKKQKIFKEFGDDGGYNPSFSSQEGQSSPSAAAKNKNQFLEDLFGSPAKNDKISDHNDHLISSDVKRSSARRSDFLWDDDSKSPLISANLVRKRENSSTIFGGGTALIEGDETSSNNSKLLPRRPRHTSTFHSKPAVTAVDNIDDDLEEVIL